MIDAYQKDLDRMYILLQISHVGLGFVRRMKSSLRDSIKAIRDLGIVEAYMIHKAKYNAWE